MIRRGLADAALGALAAVLLLAAAAVAEEPASALAGRWELVDAAERLVIEFRTDGTYSAETEIGRFDGRWLELEGGRLATWSDESRPRRVNQFRFEDGLLLIGNEGTPAHRHRRLE